MSKKILIVEDDINISTGLQAKFRIEGMEVMVNNGTEKIKDIIDNINTNKPNYIILDLLLPEIDGFDLLSAIKANAHSAKTPVFVFTNLTDRDTREQCEKLGANYYFSKNDFNIDEFVTKINKIIENTKTQK